MVQKVIRGGICHAIHQYVKANSKYIEDYDRNKESSYLTYWDLVNQHRWAMSQKFSVNGFQQVRETSQFNKGFIESYNKESAEGYFLEVDIQYPEKLHELHNDLPFLSERMKINKHENLVANLHHKKICFHVRNLK